MNRAAVDVGSNSVRLKVVDESGGQLARELAITRLATDVDRTGRLDDAALRRTLDTIACYRDVWTAHGVRPGDVRIAATSAVRDAADRARFFTAVSELTGVEAEVLTGEAEALAAYRGVRAGLDTPRPTAVLDIGGGSTEVIVGDGDDGVAAWCSLQLGSVRLTERCLADDPPTAAQVATARAEVDRRLDELDERLAAQGVELASAAVLVGVAGTVTTLAALDAGLDGYVEGAVHGRLLTREALSGWAEDLCRRSAAAIAALGPVQPGREDVLAAGALIAAGVVDRAGLPGLRVSESDILDGLALPR